MPTSVAVSRDYSRGMVRGGSRLAVSAVQVAGPGPSLFYPGTYSPAAGVVKLAHAILAGIAQKRYREAEAQAAADQQEKQDLELDKLRRESDPEYMSPYQRAMLHVAQDREARLGAPPTATPRAPVHLGDTDAKFYGFPGEGDYDPQAVKAAKDRITSIRLKDAAGQAKERAAARAASATRYTKARAELEQYDKDRVRVQDEAEANVRAMLEVQRTRYSTLGSGQRRALADSLGVAENDRGRATLTGDFGAHLIRKARLDAATQYDRNIAPKRAAALKVIQTEAGTLEGGTGDPLLDVIRETLNQPDDDEN